MPDVITGIVAPNSVYDCLCVHSWFMKFVAKSGIPYFRVLLKFKAPDATKRRTRSERCDSVSGRGTTWGGRRGNKPHGVSASLPSAQNPPFPIFQNK